MDGRQFDSIAKGFAERRSRRGALKALLGGALGGGAMIAGAGSAGATKPVKPVKADCCPSDYPTLCGLTCTSVSADPGNCGSCGNACPAGQSCVNSACVGKAIGQACTVNTECGSGFCADGVCCNGACTGQCESCNQPNNVGACTAVSGAPAGGRAACTTDGTSCGGSCNGIDRTACTYPGASTTCRSDSCSGGVQSSAATCDGVGSCQPSTTQACAPYICGPTACTTNCTSDAGCVAAGYCDLSDGSPGVCRQDLANGIACAGDAQCLSGHCVGGVCCNTACTGVASGCVSCATGTCANVSSGTVCPGGMCDGAGVCAGCLSAADCPGVDTECQVRNCTVGSCGFVNAGSGVPIANQIPGDCHRIVCDGSGGTMTIVDDTDAPPDDGNQCTSDACIDGVPSHPALAPGSACNQNGGKFCDGAGACVQCLSGADCLSKVCSGNVCQATTCADGVKNGSETDIDCGGDVCQPCAHGKMCLNNTDCVSPPNADGVCNGASGCGFACHSGFGDCNADPTDGCEVDLRNDSGNCGSCGHACVGGTPNCVNSSCVASLG